jgi:hypothetical protein
LSQSISLHQFDLRVLAPDLSIDVWKAMNSNPPAQLSIIALGIREDGPVDRQQPPSFVGGMHLWWRPALGLPRNGFHLFSQIGTLSRSGARAEMPV